MTISNDLISLLQQDFKEDIQQSSVSPDIRGKVIVFYGGNNLGKTNQASKFPNSIFFPVEKGMNAINGAMALKTTCWGDLQKHARKLSNKKYLQLLRNGEAITLVIDGIERIGTYCQNYLCAKYNVDDIGKANNGYGCWKEYDNLVWSWVDKIIGQGYTVVFIGHRKMDKDTKKFVIDGDERNIKPIRDNADIVCYLESNGIDDKGNVIHSSGYLAETDEFFARTRFTYMNTYIEDFTAENFINTVIEGIKKQNEIEGYENVDYLKQQEIYGKDCDNFEDVVTNIGQIYTKLDQLNKLDEYDEIVRKHLGNDIVVSEATPKQIEALKCIKDELEDLLNEE